MRGAVLGSKVGLDLDDATHPAPALRGGRVDVAITGVRLPHQEGAEERLGGIERRSGQGLPREAAGLCAGSLAQSSKMSFTAGGKTAPKANRIAGTIRSRTIEAVRDVSSCWWISRMNGNSGPETFSPTVR